jgi:hypothetical protein
MDIVWQDSPGSFLDSGSIDAASAFAPVPGADGSALWSSAADRGSSATGDALLWDDDAASRASWQANLAAAGMSSPDWGRQFGLSSGSLDIAWADGSGNGPSLLWQPNGSAAPFSFAASPLDSSMEWTSSLPTPAGILWSASEPTTLPAFVGLSAPTPNTPLADGLLPRLGTTPQPPPLEIPFSRLSSMPASQLVWDSSSSAVALPVRAADASAGPAPPVAPGNGATPLVPNSPGAPYFAAHP